MSILNLRTLYSGILIVLGQQAGFAADAFRDCPTCPQMVVIPAGKFIMGSNAYPSERPPTQVTIPNKFAVGKFEVTFDEWEACVNDNGCQSNKEPSGNGWGKGKRPVIFTTWVHAVEFIGWLNTKVENNPYRLPSEAEWEYASRADKSGNKRTNYSWGDLISCDMANFGGRKGSVCFKSKQGEYTKTRKVGSYPANRFGLHDMHGNVWEWVQDCWHSSYANLPAKVKNIGAAWEEKECIFRVIRGGSWINEPDRLRSSNRSRLGAVNRDINYGFRIARSLP